MAVDSKNAVDRRDAVPPTERRQHERLPAERIKGLSLQLSPGTDVVLQDISRGGARFQGETRLSPGVWIDLRLVTPDGVVTMRSKVVRSRLVRMQKGGMVYEAAVSFAELIPQVTFAEASGTTGDGARSRVCADDAPRGPETASSHVVSKDDEALPVMLLTASVRQSIVELHEVFNGNDW